MKHTISIHSALRVGILLLALLGSMGVTAQTNKATQSNGQPMSLPSSNEEDSISGREFVGKVYDVVEEQPSFPGGQTALMSWISENFHYPSTCESISGRMVISFIVEPDGSLTHFQVERQLDPELDEEAVRLVKAMPKWIPVKHNNQPVRAKFTLPITFKLSDDCQKFY